MEKVFKQDQQEDANSPASEESRSLFSRNLPLPRVRQGLLNTANALYSRKHLLGLIGAIIVFIGAFMPNMADLPLTWLVALASIAAGILVFRPHSGKFIMITGISIAVYALITYWELTYPFSISAGVGWGIITAFVGGCLLCYAGSVMRQFNWSLYIAKHLSWKAFLGFGVNARIRVYCYLAVLLFSFSGFYIGNMSFLVRQALIAIVDNSALPKEASFRENASCHQQAVAIKNNILDVFACNHDVHSYGNNERMLQAKTGLTKVQLQRFCAQHALMPLVTAALKLHCLPEEVTTIVKDPYTKSPAAISTELRRANGKHAQEIYQEEVDQFWQEVKPDITITFARPGDYCHASLWKEGWERFTGTSKELIREAEYRVPNPLGPR